MKTGDWTSLLMEQAFCALTVTSLPRPGPWNWTQDQVGLLTQGGPGRLARCGAGHLRHPVGAGPGPGGAPQAGGPLHAQGLCGAPGHAHHHGAPAQRSGRRPRPLPSPCPARPRSWSWRLTSWAIGIRTKVSQKDLARVRALRKEAGQKGQGSAQAGAGLSTRSSAPPRVLDPACGSGNFLYVSMEHMKRLEGEVLEALAQFGHQPKGL